MVVARAFNINVLGLGKPQGGLPTTNVGAKEAVNQFIQNDFIRSDQQPAPNAYGGFQGPNRQLGGGSNIGGYR